MSMTPLEELIVGHPPADVLAVALAAATAAYTLDDDGRSEHEERIETMMNALRLLERGDLLDIVCTLASFAADSLYQEVLRTAQETDPGAHMVATSYMQMLENGLRTLADP